MGLDVTPSEVHMLAEGVGSVADAVRRLGSDFSVGAASGDFEVDAVLGQLDAHLLAQFATLGGNVAALAESMHASATSIQKVEARNTDAIEGFNFTGGEGV
ncbi:MAG: hypothetical protein Q4P15_00235 [Propionibacteriaceae bacterium]|nr:hypothetical protein [Propionibacteriaceae bacterium]